MTSDFSIITRWMVAMVAVMWLIILSPTNADTSCCTDSDGCDESCPWNNACSFGRDYECMEDVGGYWSCQDRHGACQDYDSCSIDEAARRAGILCGNKFPYYNGGYPMDSWKWQNVEEDLRCLAQATNGSYCESWEGHSNSNQYYEISHSNCTSTDATRSYCQQWSTKILMYRKCFSAYVSSDNGNKLTTVCCHSGNHLQYDCCRNACPISTYSRRPVTTEYMNCQCEQQAVVTNATTTNPYCAQWSCDRYATTNQTYDEGRTTSTFQCVNTTTSTAMATNGTSTSTSTNTNTACTRWTGSSEEQTQFAVTSCTCSSVNVSSNSSSSSSHPAGFCSQWSCHSKGTFYVIPNTLWVLLNAVLGGFFWLVMILVTERYRQRNRDMVSYTAHAALMHRHGDIVTRVAPKMKASVVRAFVFPWLMVWVWCAPLTVIAVWKTGLMAFFTGFLPILLMTMGVMAHHSYWYHFYARQIPPTTTEAASRKPPSSLSSCMSATGQCRWICQPLHRLYAYFNGSTPIFCCWDTVICCAPASSHAAASAATAVAMTTATMTATQCPASSAAATAYTLAPSSASASASASASSYHRVATTTDDGATTMHRRGLGPVHCFCCTVDNIGMCLYRHAPVPSQSPNPIVEQPTPSTATTTLALAAEATSPPSPAPTILPATLQPVPQQQQQQQQPLAATAPPSASSQQLPPSDTAPSTPKTTTNNAHVIRPPRSDPLESVLADTADMRLTSYDDPPV